MPNSVQSATNSTSDSPAGLGAPPSTETLQGTADPNGERSKIAQAPSSQTRTRYENGCLSCTLARATTPTNVPAALGDPISCSNYPISCQISNLKKVLCGGSTNERLKEHSSTHRQTDRHSTRTSSWAYVLTSDIFKVLAKFKKKSPIFKKSKFKKNL